MNRNLSDFTKTALSMATGMIAVVGTIAWRTHGNLLAIGIAGGLPLGVVLFWAIYNIKIRISRLEQTLRILQAPKPQRLNFGLGVHDNPLTPLPVTPKGKRLIIGKTLYNPAKERLLTGRSPILHDKSHLDQWHD